MSNSCAVLPEVNNALEREADEKIDIDPFVQDLACYEVESKASAAGWAEIQDGILAAVTETSAMSVGALCLRCKNAASYQCCIDEYGRPVSYIS